MNTIHSSLTTAVSSQKSYRADTHAKPHTAQREDPTTIAIVSPSRLLHEGLATALGRYLNVVVVAGYDGDVVPDDADNTAQITLLDGSLGRERVYSWLTYWREQRTPVLVLELPNDPGVIVDYLQAGASSYCAQGAPIVEVAMAIQSLRHGKPQFSPDVSAEICARLWTLGVPNRETSIRHTLTPRETEILRCLAAGMSNQEIADHFVIHILTVKHHVHHILKKLNLSRRWDAARIAIESGLTLDDIRQSG